VWNSPVGRVRGVGMIEGVSFLVLLLVAMPLKYRFKLPEGEAIVFWVGLVHGVLFVTYALVAFRANHTGHLPKKLLGYAAVASVVPFGPFVIDRKLKQAAASGDPDAAAHPEASP
jgi:integral membrane protein